MVKLVEGWYRRARLFILEQRQVELKRAIIRYPNSDRFQLRTDELAEVEKEISELKG